MSVYIIAEAGVNHNGDIELARKLVEIAVDAGADAVKFQTFKTEELAVSNAPKANYQEATTPKNESQHEMLHRLELTPEMHSELLGFCNEKGIEFLSTAFDISSVHYLTQTLGLKTLKIPSGELTNGPLILEAGRNASEIILSTGMSTIEEVQDAVSVLAFALHNDKNSPPSKNAFRSAFNNIDARRKVSEKVTLLHCTTEYPAPFDSVNLRAMNSMSSFFDIPVGYSDHTLGISVPIAAVGLGATVIEKHFTIDKNLPGPDHKASLEPIELGLMVKNIRDIEKALGSDEKKVAPVEKKNRNIIRKSLVATQDIKGGEKFTPENMGAKRPGSGISPMEYWDYLDTPSDRNISKDELI
jgi:N-acetylneuraminate synthase